MLSYDNKVTNYVLDYLLVPNVVNARVRVGLCGLCTSHGTDINVTRDTQSPMLRTRRLHQIYPAFPHRVFGPGRRRVSRQLSACKSAENANQNAVVEYSNITICSAYFKLDAAETCSKKVLINIRATVSFVKF